MSNVNFKKRQCCPVEFKSQGPDRGPAVVPTGPPRECHRKVKSILPALTISWTRVSLLSSTVIDATDLLLLLLISNYKGPNEL